jgi:hypothetical protein
MGQAPLRLAREALYGSLRICARPMNPIRVTSSAVAVIWHIVIKKIAKTLVGHPNTALDSMYDGHYIIAGEPSLLADWKLPN